MFGIALFWACTVDNFEVLHLMLTQYARCYVCALEVVACDAVYLTQLCYLIDYSEVPFTHHITVESLTFLSLTEE